jgi:phosphocarrier protein HPr
MTIARGRTRIAPSTRPVAFCLLRLNMAKVSKEVIVSNERGLHARPAMQFVDVANGFTSQIMVVREGDEPLEVDGKSVMQMITLEAVQGTPLRILAEGDDAYDAGRKLVELFESKFGEE